MSVQYKGKCKFSGRRGGGEPENPGVVAPGNPIEFEFRLNDEIRVLVNARRLDPDGVTRTKVWGYLEPDDAKALYTMLKVEFGQ